MSFQSPDPRPPGPARPGRQYDPHEIRLRRRVERLVEGIGRGALRTGLDPLGRWLGAPLAEPAELVPAPVIVVLGAGIRSTGRLSATSRERVRHGVALLRAGLAGTLVLSGGPRRPGRPPVAPALAALAVDLGAPPECLQVEDRSSRTAENAAFVAALLRGSGIEEILLVTTPLHMRRARRCFEHHGVRVHPAPVVEAPTDEEAGRASLLAQALHEWLGLAYYRLRGWI